MKKRQKQKQVNQESNSKVFHYGAVFSLLSSFLVLFFFTSLMMYDQVCYFESKMEILLFEWLLAALVFIVSIRAIYLLFFKKHEIKIFKK